jgi:NhaP-type Na+/H+ or K+/H+ antiporter
MGYAGWLVAIGILLVAIYATGHLVARMPASPALIYLVIGMAIGPWGFGWLQPDPHAHHVLLERGAEIAVLVSLFATGSAVGATLHVTHWRVPVRLASTAMIATVLLLAAFAHWVLGLSAGASLVLAGALAPTDPVLAGDVQVADARDRDRLRFGLTGEAGLNDGAAFPFVLAGLAMLGVDPALPGGWGPWALAATWGIAGGLALGALLGMAAGRWVARRTRDGVTSETSEAFLGLGLVSATYGIALLIGAYGFVAVFAAAVALRGTAAAEVGGAADRASITPMQQFNAGLESLFEFAIVIVCGALVTVVAIPPSAVALALVLFLVVRPVSVLAALAGTRLEREQRMLAAWFGIRGVGSIYYVFFALSRDWRGEEADYVLGLVLGVVAASIILHGISVTPLMSAYERHARAWTSRRNRTT